MSNTEPVRIDLSGDDWIEIRPRRSWASKQRIEGASVSVQHDGVGTVIGADVNMLGRGIAVMQSALLAWSLPHPISLEFMLSDDFDPDLGDEIVGAINSYYESQVRDAPGKSS